MSLFDAPRHAGREQRSRVHFGRAGFVTVGVICLLAVFGSGALGDPSGQSSATSQLAAAPTTPQPVPTPTGTVPGGPAWVKGGGLVTAPKSATSILQPLQVLYAPANYSQQEPGHPPVILTQAWVYPFTDPAVPGSGAYGHYRYFDDITAHTLAFGSIPVSLSIRVSEPLDSRGQPIPLYILEKYTSKNGVVKGVQDPTITGQLTIQLLNVSIDGNPLNVGSSCQTSQPAQLMAGAQFVLPTPPFTRPPMPTGSESPSYGVLQGGYLKGTLVVPNFSGCQNGSENLDPLFDTAVSGATDVLLTSTGPNNLPTCEQSPPPPGTFCGPITLPPLPTNPVNQH